MDGLKPCPFCGGRAFMENQTWARTTWWVMCNGCESRSDLYDTEAEAIAAWNTRAERTCHIVERPDGFGSFDSVCSECGEDYIFGRYCAGCGAKVVEE